MAGQESGQRGLSKTESHNMTTLGGNVGFFVDVEELGTRRSGGE